MWSGQVDDLEHQGRLVLLARFEGVVVLNSVVQDSRGLIVVVDDDGDIRLALSMLLPNEGYTVLEADSPMQLARIVARTPSLVLLDMN